MTLEPVDGEEWDLVQKGQPLAVGELKGVRNTQDCEKEWGGPPGRDQGLQLMCLIGWCRLQCCGLWAWGMFGQSGWGAEKSWR